MLRDTPLLTRLSLFGAENDFFQGVICVSSFVFGEHSRNRAVGQTHPIDERISRETMAACI
jgi:hypothetical protein